MSPVAPVDSVHAHPILLHPSSCFCRYASPSGPLLGALVCQRGRWQQRGIITPIGEEAVCRRLFAYVTCDIHLFVRLPASLAGIMHALRPGTDELLCFACSLETRRIKRGFRLCVRVCASVSGVPCLCACRICCVTYRYFHQVRAGLLLLLVDRGDLETKRSACARVSVR